MFVDYVVMIAGTHFRIVDIRFPRMRRDSDNSIVFKRENAVHRLYHQSLYKVPLCDNHNIIDGHLPNPETELVCLSRIVSPYVTCDSIQSSNHRVHVGAKRV